MPGLKQFLTRRLDLHLQPNAGGHSCRISSRKCTGYITIYYISFFLTAARIYRYLSLGAVHQHNSSVGVAAWTFWPQCIQLLVLNTELYHEVSLPPHLSASRVRLPNRRQMWRLTASFSGSRRHLATCVVLREQRQEIIWVAAAANAGAGGVCRGTKVG